MNKIFGVITYQNFFLTGTLRESLKWRNPNFNEKLAL